MSKAFDIARTKIPQDKPTTSEEGIFRYNPTLKTVEGYIIRRLEQTL